MGSALLVKTIGMVAVARLAAKADAIPSDGGEHGDLPPDHICCEIGQEFDSAPSGPTVFKDNVAANYIADLIQEALMECLVVAARLILRYRRN